jgi:hypothetical protein
MKDSHLLWIERGVLDRDLESHLVRFWGPFLLPCPVGLLWDPMSGLLLPQLGRVWIGNQVLNYLRRAMHFSLAYLHRVRQIKNPHIVVLLHDIVRWNKDRSRQ